MRGCIKFFSTLKRSLKEEALLLEREAIQISIIGNHEKLNKVDWTWLNDKWAHEVSREDVRNN